MSSMFKSFGSNKTRKLGNSVRKGVSNFSGRVGNRVSSYSKRFGNRVLQTKKKMGDYVTNGLKFVRNTAADTRKGLGNYSIDDDDELRKAREAANRMRRQRGMPTGSKGSTSGLFGAYSPAKGGAKKRKTMKRKTNKRKTMKRKTMINRRN